MRDEAVVLDVRNGRARVKVKPQAACCDCAARAFCQGNERDDDVMTVLNPMGARPGDPVLIEIPEEKYAREAARLFGALLAAIVAGFGLGTAVAWLFHLPLSELGFAGLLLGLGIGGLVILRSSRRPGRTSLYPAIKEIIDKGDRHEKA